MGADGEMGADISEMGFNVSPNLKPNKQQSPTNKQQNPTKKPTKPNKQTNKLKSVTEPGGFNQTA